MDPIVIIGAGQTGGRAALALRECGHAGPVLLLGAEASAPYERPPLSKAFLAGEQDAQDFTFASADMLAGAGIEFRPASRVAGSDRLSRRVRLAGGEELAYAKLLLA